MTRKTFNLAEEVYTAPLCTISDITSEGVLCNSFEEPNECDDIYEW